MDSLEFAATLTALSQSGAPTGWIDGLADALRRRLDYRESFEKEIGEHKAAYLPAVLPGKLAELAQNYRQNVRSISSNCKPRPAPCNWRPTRFCWSNIERTCGNWTRSKFRKNI
jgi:hypothetical protein